VVAVAVAVAACGASAGRPANIDGFSVTDDPRVIIVSFTSGRCDEVTPMTVTETDDAVTVSVFVVAAPHDQSCDSLIPRGHRERITLQKALGSRKVRGLNGGAGAPLIPLTPAP
jgi:hypothetical protein